MKWFFCHKNTTFQTTHIPENFPYQVPYSYQITLLFPWSIKILNIKYFFFFFTLCFEFVFNLASYSVNSYVQTWFLFITTSLLYRCSTLRTQICLPPTRDILFPLQFSFQSPESSEHKSHSILCYYLYKNFPLLSTIDTHHHNIDLLLPLEPICNINFKHPALKPSHPMS